MIKIWWGALWRVNLLCLLVLTPILFLYGLIEPTDFTIKFKPSVLYFLLSLLALYIANNNRLNSIIWNGLIPQSSLKKIVNSYAICFTFSAIVNLLMFMRNTDQWVDTKLALGIFTFFVFPITTPLLSKYFDETHNSVSQ